MVRYRNGALAVFQRREKLYDVLCKCMHLRFGKIWSNTTSFAPASTAAESTTIPTLVTEMPRCDVESMFYVVLQQRRGDN